MAPPIPLGHPGNRFSQLDSRGRASKSGRLHDCSERGNNPEATASHSTQELGHQQHTSGEDGLTRPSSYTTGEE